MSCITIEDNVIISTWFTFKLYCVYFINERNIRFYIYCINFVINFIFCPAAFNWFLPIKNLFNVPVKLWNIKQIFKINNFKFIIWNYLYVKRNTALSNPCFKCLLTCIKHIHYSVKKVCQNGRKPVWYEVFRFGRFWITLYIVYILLHIA